MGFFTTGTSDNRRTEMAGNISSLIWGKEHQRSARCQILFFQAGKIPHEIFTMFGVHHVDKKPQISIQAQAFVSLSIGYIFFFLHLRATRCVTWKGKQNVAERILSREREQICCMQESLTGNYNASILQARFPFFPFWPCHFLQDFFCLMKFTQKSWGPRKLHTTTAVYRASAVFCALFFPHL